MSSSVEKPPNNSAPMRNLPFWPNGVELSFDQLRTSSWQPTPFTLFLCKIHSRCNLNCTYCYIYNQADQLWRQQPKVMPITVVKRTALRVREHVIAHQLQKIHIIMHGGEPLLAGTKYIQNFTAIMREVLGDTCETHFEMQSNGTLLTPEIAEVLIKEGIRVGISLDGPEEINDLHRLHLNGRSSYQQVRAGLALLVDPRYQSCFSGILCTIQLASDPLIVFRHLCEMQPPGLDFLLPHGNWTTPPPGKFPPFQDTPYADWLIPIFDVWYELPKRLEIRFFGEIINMLFGGVSRVESLGLSPVGLITIETNGQLEGVDTLKSTYEGAGRIGMSVFSHSFDEALQQPSIIARQIGKAALHPTCLSCSIHQVCGAGYFPHRYDAITGFRNPSIYCSDLTKLILHIYHRVKQDISRFAGATIQQSSQEGT